MIIDAKSGIRGVLVDATTGRRIPFARYANLETGEWEAFQATLDGKLIAKPLNLLKGKCPLRFVESYAPKVKPVSVADRQAAVEEMEEVRRTTEQRLLLPGDYCEAKGCHRLAEWHVSWHKLLTPVVGPHGMPQERLALLSVHDYCSRHYRLPRETSLRGIEQELQVAVRPQW